MKRGYRKYFILAKNNVFFIPYLLLFLNHNMSYKKTFLTLCFLMVTCIVFIKCSGNNKKGEKDVRGYAYAGSSTCLQCHKNIGGNYLHSSHFTTSAMAKYSALDSIINSTNNSVAFISNQKVALNEKDSAFFQSYFHNDQPVQSAKIDVVFGSGKDAQTFGYWKDSQLYELPLTYLTKLKAWTNSPGFPVDKPYFTRIIPSRCLECHTSYAAVTEEREGHLLQVKQKFNPDKIVFGIDCERCHGPGAKHVQFQQENPGIKQAKFITSIKSLTRQQQLDMCGTCHSGNPVSMRSIFAFAPGDTLSKYYLFYNRSTGEPDVHGMQLQLLQLSQCFKKSTMTCNTCHTTHRPNENDLLYINTCAGCHTNSTHATQMKATNQNCIKCHMPLRSSKSLDFNNETVGNNIQYMLRTHRIAVYPSSEWK